MRVRYLLLFLVVPALASRARASVLYTSQTYSDGFANSGTVPDDNLSGWSDTRSISGMSGSIASVNVRLNLSGGYNGDLYGYISYNNMMVVLLNRPGVGTINGGTSFGYDGAGLNVTFTDSAGHNIHFYQYVGGSITGGSAWQPDGRTVDPTSTDPAAFNAAGTGTLASFNNMDPNGSWTLFLADVVGGGSSPSVVSWGLDVQTVSAVPEPLNQALVLFGLGLVGLKLGHCSWRYAYRRYSSRAAAAGNRPAL